MRLTGRSFLVAATMLAASTTGWAQDTSSPEYVEARNRLQEGKALYGQRNIDGARLKFEQACAVLKTPACQRALGLAQYYTNRYLEALGNLQRALDDPELDTVQRKEVTDLMQQAYDKTGHLEIRAPAGAHVRIDDTVDAGNAPLHDVVNVTIGSHTISVQVEDKTERKTVECSEGKVMKVDFADRFPNMQNGNGNPPGGEETHSRIFPPPTGAIVTGVLGLVGLGIGIGFGAASGSANDTNVLLGTTQGNGQCTTSMSSALCQQAESTRQSQQSDALASTVAYVAGGVFIAVAVIWWIAAPRKIVEHRAALLPSVGPRTGGMGLTYSF
jgi:hypothetical protein